MSKKYSQRGYQEDDGPKERRPVVRERREGPRGRGLGKPTKEVFRCRDCGHEVKAKELDPSGSVAIDATCAGCGVDLHSCVNCSQFDTSARFECRQPIPERIRSKTKRNDCTAFKPKVALEQDSSSDGPAPTPGKAAFDALFD